MKRILLSYLFGGALMIISFLLLTNKEHHRFVEASNINSTLEQYNEQLLMENEAILEKIYLFQHKNHSLAPIYECAKRAEQHRKGVVNSLNIGSFNRGKIYNRLRSFKYMMFKSLDELRVKETAGVKVTGQSIQKLRELAVFDSTLLYGIEGNMVIRPNIALKNVALLLENQFLQFLFNLKGDKMLCYVNFNVYTQYLPDFKNEGAGQLEVVVGDFNYCDEVLYPYDYERYYVNDSLIEFSGDGCIYTYVPRKRGLDSLHLRAERFDEQDSMIYQEEQWIKFWVE